MENTRITTDPLNQLKVGIRDTRVGVARRNNARRVTLPLYDADDEPTNPIFGEIRYDSFNQEWVYGLDEAWHIIGAPYVPPSFASYSAIFELDASPSELLAGAAPTHLYYGFGSTILPSWIGSGLTNSFPYAFTPTATGKFITVFTFAFLCPNADGDPTAAGGSDTLHIELVSGTGTAPAGGTVWNGLSPAYFGGSPILNPAIAKYYAQYCTVSGTIQGTPNVNNWCDIAITCSTDISIGRGGMMMQEVFD